MINYTCLQASFHGKQKNASRISRHSYSLSLCLIQTYFSFIQPFPGIGTIKKKPNQSIKLIILITSCGCPLLTFLIPTSSAIGYRVLSQQHRFLCRPLSHHTQSQAALSALVTMYGRPSFHLGCSGDGDAFQKDAEVCLFSSLGK